MCERRIGQSGVAECLLALRKGQEEVDVRWWGFEELRQEVFRLGVDDVAALLGPAPAPSDFVNIGFDKSNRLL